MDIAAFSLCFISTVVSVGATEDVSVFKNWFQRWPPTACHKLGWRDLRFSRRWRFKSWSSGLWCHVVMW